MTEQYPKLRKLKMKDRKKFGSLVIALQERTGKTNLTEMVPASGEETTETEAVDRSAQLMETAFGLLSSMLTYLEEDLKGWFIDILEGIETPEEYDDLPFDIEMYIIEELITKEEFTGFFVRGSQLFKKIKGLAGQQ